ncbi:MAG: serine/threonine-protein kinase [Candidatus Omnitrophota bacterium]
MKNPKSFETACGDYSVVSVIGEGGAGRVFLVRDHSGKEMALKCLYPELITTERRKRFKNEIDFCQRECHENLIRVIDSGLMICADGKTPFYVMPFFPMTLRALIEKRIPSDKVLPIFNQILNGVEAAHLLGVTHRDLKPENILYDPNRDLIVVADFGIAHFEEDVLATTVETQPASKMANFSYAAPEQRSKGSNVDLRVDIYALGLILNEMFTTKVPHGTGYQKIETVAPSYTYLDSLIEIMIQQSPGARPSNIEDIKKGLIGRKNSFVVLQHLDAKKHEVVLASTPQQFTPIKLKGVDWSKGMLLFELDQVPPRKWIELFQNPSGYSAIYGYGPSAIGFQKNTAMIRIEERLAQQIVNHFKEYLNSANREYQKHLSTEAAQRELEQRRQLEQEIAEAETRGRILKNVKI